MSNAEILLVEDDRCSEELALRALRKAGYDNVSVARDGVEALAMLLGEQGKPADRPEPALVLLDMKLPKIDGVGVLRRIRDHQRTSNLKVLTLSCSEDPQEIETCLELGVLAVLPKPLDPERLKNWHLPAQEEVVGL
jgi:two-component system, response regulator